MKKRWIEYEMIFVTVLALVQCVSYLLQQGSLDTMVWVQMGSVALFYIAYIAVNLIIAPPISKLLVEHRSIIGIIIPAVWMLFIGLLLSMGVNWFTELVSPHLRNYAGHGLLALLGYQEPPIRNWFQGFDRALVLLFGWTCLTVCRDLFLERVSRSPRKEWWTDMLTHSGFLLMLLGLYALTEKETINIRTLSLLTALLWGTALVYWLFPKAEHPLKEPKIWFIAMVTLILCALPAYWIVFRYQPLQSFIRSTLLVAVLTGPIAYYLFQRQKERFRRLGMLQQKLADTKASLSQLKAQVNPHFLFNALNTLYGTALSEGADNAAAGIQKLGDMMRFMLTDNDKDMIPVQKEREYLQNYIDLQLLRIQQHEKITIAINIEEIGCKGSLPPMIMIPFIENAFKYGISPVDPSWIDIRLYCKAGKIFLVTRNSIHKNQIMNQESTGIGIENVRQRLDLQYGKNYQLDIHNTGNEFLVKLQMSLQDA